MARTIKKQPPEQKSRLQKKAFTIKQKKKNKMNNKFIRNVTELEDEFE